MEIRYEVLSLCLLVLMSLWTLLLPIHSSLHLLTLLSLLSFLALLSSSPRFLHVLVFFGHILRRIKRCMAACAHAYTLPDDPNFQGIRPHSRSPTLGSVLKASVLNPESNLNPTMSWRLRALGSLLSWDILISLPNISKYLCIFALLFRLPTSWTRWLCSVKCYVKASYPKKLLWAFEEAVPMVPSASSRCSVDVRSEDMLLPFSTSPHSSSRQRPVNTYQVPPCTM